LLRFGPVIRVELPRALPPPRPRHIVITLEHRERYRGKQTPTGYYSCGHSLLPCKTAHTSRLRPIPHLRFPAAVDSPSSCPQLCPIRRIPTPSSTHMHTRSTHARMRARNTRAHTSPTQLLALAHAHKQIKYANKRTHEPIVDHFCGLLPAAWAYWATPATVDFLTQLKKKLTRTCARKHTHARALGSALLRLAFWASPSPVGLLSKLYAHARAHTNTHACTCTHKHTHTHPSGSATRAPSLSLRWRAPLLLLLLLLPPGHRARRARGGWAGGRRRHMWDTGAPGSSGRQAAHAPGRML
jgi:hypothetical protein